VSPQGAPFLKFEEEAIETAYASVSEEVKLSGGVVEALLNNLSERLQEGLLGLVFNLLQLLGDLS